MQRNVAGPNCTFRILFGLVLLVMGFCCLGALWQYLTVLTGTYLLVPGLLRFRPMSALFRRRPCPPEQPKPG